MGEYVCLLHRAVKTRLSLSQISEATLKALHSNLPHKTTSALLHESHIKLKCITMGSQPSIPNYWCRKRLIHKTCIVWVWVCTIKCNKIKENSRICTPNLIKRYIKIGKLHGVVQQLIVISDSNNIVEMCQMKCKCILWGLI